TPEIAFIQKPSHITGRNRFISANGTCRATPRIRRAITAFNPATNPIPTACKEMIPGNANADVDSRTQVLSEVASSQMKKGSMPEAAMTLSSRGDLERLVQPERNDRLDGDLDVALGNDFGGSAG